jgi:isopenicillin N synthase-like dioxygenase
MPKLSSVPCVNIQQFTHGSTKEAAEFTRLFGRGLQEFGFVVVEGHGVEPQTIRQAYAQVKAFFDLPTETKARYELPGGGGQRGYTGFGKEHAKNQQKGDLKEFWHVGREVYQGPEKLYAPNVWPEDAVPGFRSVMQSLYEKLDAFSVTLLEATSLYLGLDRYVLPKMVRDGNSILRCIQYPPLTPEQFASGAVRAAAHEDINFITILCEATESGLELLTRDGRWLEVESGPGQMVVDSGDMLARVCNDVIPSTTHRVVNPKNSRNVTRHSMPFFVHPYSQCELKILPQCVSPSAPAHHSPITAHEFLEQRLRELGLRN